MARTRWIGVVTIAAGCASTVSSGAADAARDDGRSPEVAVGDAGSAVDAAVDGPVDVVADAPIDDRFDAATDARVCAPIVDDDVPAADVPDAAPYVTALSPGSAVGCARMSDGTLRCRSVNDDGELGIGSFGGPWRGAVTVPGLSDVEQVATSIGRAVCARLRDGTVRCWGSNRFGLLGTGHVDEEACAYDFPCRTRPTVVPGLTDVVHLAAGPLGFCAVRRDGTVWCWGPTDVLLPFGGSPVPLRSDAISGAARMWSTPWGWVIRMQTGAVVLARPGGPIIEPLPIPPEAEFADADDGPSFALCFRLRDATARCFGISPYGNLGDGTSTDASALVTTPVDPGLCGVRQVVGGHTNSCAVMVDHTVSCWGSGDENALGDTAPDTCVGYDGHSPTPCATRPIRLRGLTEVERVFTGYLGGCARRFDRTLWCWGAQTGSLARELTQVTW